MGEQPASLGSRAPWGWGWGLRGARLALQSTQSPTAGCYPPGSAQPSLSLSLSPAKSSCVPSLRRPPPSLVLLTAPAQLLFLLPPSSGSLASLACVLVAHATVCISLSLLPPPSSSCLLAPAFSFPLCPALPPWFSRGPLGSLPAPWHAPRPPVPAWFIQLQLPPPLPPSVKPCFLAFSPFPERATCRHAIPVRGPSPRSSPQGCLTLWVLGRESLSRPHSRVER